METLYGEIPENLVKDITVQEMHDYLKAHYRRRSVLKGAGVLGLAAAAGPLFWRQSSALASTASAPQWIAYGEDPATQMYVSWSAGTSDGTTPAVPRPLVRWGLDHGYGRIEPASFSGPVPVPAISGEPAENTVYSNALLTNLFPNTRYHYSVSNDGVHWSDDVTFTTAAGGGQGLYTGWYGTTGGGDSANASGPPLVWEWTGTDTADGGTGTADDIPDTVTGYSAYRRANWSFIVLDVAAPKFPGGETTVLIRAVDPTQNATGITSTASPVVMDSVTLARRSSFF